MFPFEVPFLISIHIEPYLTQVATLHKAFGKSHVYSSWIELLLIQFDELKEMRCIPSKEKPCPGKLGYFIGAHTGRNIPGKHAWRAHM